MSTAAASAAIDTALDARTAFARSEVAARYARHVNPAFVELLGALGYGRVMVRAQDVWLWDDAGMRYFDALAGFGSMNLGHNHPRLVARLHALLDENVANLCHTGPSPHAAQLAEALARVAPAPLEVALFANSGAEAVEAALKLARAATGRARFIACANGFHGSNLGTLSLMDARRWRKPFEPLLAECETVPFGDLDALALALARGKAAAFVVEPLQGEGGVHPAPPGYLRAAQALCAKHGTLLVLDEVQTGMGRCGTLFACEAEGVAPDVLVLGKALGGGLVPISAALVSCELHARAYGKASRFDLHGSTFGGNAFACVAAIETLRILADEQLIANAAQRGAQLLAALRARLAGHPLVREVRGRGLLVGVELGATDVGWLNRLAPGLVGFAAEKALGQWVALRMLERGVLCQPSAHHWRVLRLEPPLTVDAAGVDMLAGTLGDVLDECRSLPRVGASLLARVREQRGLAR